MRCRGPLKLCALLALCLSPGACVSLGAPARPGGDASEDGAAAPGRAARPALLYRDAGAASVEDAVEGNFSAHLETDFSHECVQRNTPAASPKFCSSVRFRLIDLHEARLRPAMCLQDLMPGVRSKLCTMCEGVDCTKLKKTLGKIEKTFSPNARGDRNSKKSLVVKFLQKTHSIQEELRQNHDGWEAAFKAFQGHPAKHYQVCSEEVTAGTFGPGLCRKEVETVFPGYSNLVFEFVDENRNKMISNLELKHLFTIAAVVSHIAAPVIQQGATFESMLEYPFEKVLKFLDWNDQVQ